MATITRFKEPLKFEPLEYRGLDTLDVFIEDGSSDSFDYFGLTRVPRELTAGRNLISFTGTQNLVPGSEIALEVLNANGDPIPIQTYDYIGEGNERIFAIEVGPETPEGDALISIVGVAKGEVGFSADRRRDASRIPPPRFRNVFNLRWQKRLNCYPRRRNSDEITYFQNPDITVEEIKRPYFKLHYNTELTESNAAGNFPNSRSLFTLVSTGSEAPDSFNKETNTTAKVSYQVAGNKYYIIADANPDFGGFTQDMVGGTIYVPQPINPFPARFDSPTGVPQYNQLETGDGTGVLDENTQLYTKQGAYNTIISEVISPLRLRVNSPHTTFQGFGRANQREVFHQRFDDSDFRLDFAQAPVSRSNPLVSGSNNFATSYAKVSFNGLTPLVGDVTRIKTFIRNDQTVTDYFLVGDNPVYPTNLLVQTSSLVERHSAGDFSPFGVSGSLNQYWSASHEGVSPIFGNENLSIFRQLVGNVNNPIPDSLQIGDSILAHSVGQLNGTNYILVDSTVPILHQAGKYYQVEFKTFGQRVNSSTPSLKIYMQGAAINDEGDELGQMIGQITDIENQELVTTEDPLDEYKTTALKFVYKADATEFAYLRFKIEQGLWFLFDVKITPYYQYGYTPHFFDVIIPTTKANVGEVDALDFKFEFYNDAHNKALYTADISNIEFDNEFTFTATNAFFTSASIGTFIGATPMGDDDWVKPFQVSASQAQFQPNYTMSIYHSGSVGIGNFLNQDVGFPLHINKLSNEGNATIKLSSFSSSILHLASDAGGAGLPNQKNAFIFFDHNGAETSSIIGYTDTKNLDPGGATFDGAPQGSFTIHERHGKSMALGVGGNAALIIAQDGKANTAAKAVYIGYDDVVDGPFSPDLFGYELNVSGSVMISSGALHYPNIPGASTSDSDIVFLSYNSPFPPFSGDRGLIVSRSFRDSAAQLGLGADMDWRIEAAAITQSRTAAGEGRTVFIGDNKAESDVGDSLLLSTHILQISQSGTSPSSKIRISGLNELGSALDGTEDNNVLVINSNGDVFKTGSYGVGGGGGADNLGNHTATQDLNMGGFDILNAGQIVAVSITSSHITSSTLVTTGSNIFGQGGDDSHEFIGSVTGSKDIKASGNLITGGDVEVGNHINLNSANARIDFENVSSVSDPNGISYRDSGGSQRFALTMQGATNVVSLGNRAQNGSVLISANAAAGGGGIQRVAEFSASEARVKQNFTVEKEPMHSTANHVFANFFFGIEAGVTELTNNNTCLIEPFGYSPTILGNTVWYQGKLMPYSGSITSLAVSYLFEGVDIAKEFRFLVSCSVFRSGSGGGPKEHFADFNDAGTTAAGVSKGEAIHNTFATSPVAAGGMHGVSGSHIPLITEPGPLIPRDVFGSNSVGSLGYDGIISYRLTYPRDENRFAPGDRMYVNFGRVDPSTLTPVNNANSYTSGIVRGLRVEVGVIYDRSGSYGYHSGSGTGIGYSGTEIEGVA